MKLKLNVFIPKRELIIMIGDYEDFDGYDGECINDWFEIDNKVVEKLYKEFAGLDDDYDFCDDEYDYDVSDFDDFGDFVKEYNDELVNYINREELERYEKVDY